MQKSPGSLPSYGAASAGSAPAGFTPKSGGAPPQMTSASAGRSDENPANIRAQMAARDQLFASGGGGRGMKAGGAPPQYGGMQKQPQGMPARPMPVAAPVASSMAAQRAALSNQLRAK